MNARFLEYLWSCVVRGTAAVRTRVVFSSAVASVGNGFIRAAIDIRRLGCLSVEKLVQTLNTIRPSEQFYLRFTHAGFVSVLTIYKINAIRTLIARHALVPDT